MNSGKDTKISCVITGITTDVIVTWLQKGTMIDLTSTHTTSLTELENNSQTAKLMVQGSQVSSDTEYVCKVKSIEFLSSPSSDTTVHLNTYGKKIVFVPKIVQGVLLMN